MKNEERTSENKNNFRPSPNFGTFLNEDNGKIYHSLSTLTLQRQKQGLHSHT